jgi:uncharacterized protein
MKTRKLLDADEPHAEPYGNVEYADPGFNGKKRYPVNTAEHVRAAWSYVNRGRNAGKYTSEQLSHVRGKIEAAWKKLIDPKGPPSAASDAEWDESKHPRVPTGQTGGGEFSGGGNAIPENINNTLVKMGYVRENSPGRVTYKRKKGSTYYSYSTLSHAWAEVSKRPKSSGYVDIGPRQTITTIGTHSDFKKKIGAGDSWSEDANWDESSHPRVPAGGAGGGQFSGGETAGGVNQGEMGSSWHPERGLDAGPHAPDPKKFGADFSDLTEEDQVFLDRYGEKFLPVVNELFHEYDATPEVISDFMDSRTDLSDDPEKVLTAFHNSYVGSYDSEEVAAEDFIKESYPSLPKALTDTIDYSTLASNLFDNEGAPYVLIYNSDDDQSWVFKRPTPLAKDALTEDAQKPLAFEVDSVPMVIGVNDDGEALVLDAGANIHRTADGYLAASPRIARTGIQVYRGWEMGVPEKDTVRIYRPESEVFAPDSLRSYAHKPVTNDHPREAVTSDNWRKYAVGHTADEILRDGGFIRIPLMISDADTVRDVDEGKIELSLGYTMEMDWTPGETPQGEAYDGVQRNIRANHLAIVASARGGKELRVGDSGEGVTGMKTITIDGATVQVDDVAATIIPRYVAALEIRAKTAEDGLAAMTTKYKTDTETRDAEVVTLKKQVADAKLSPEQIETLVRDRTLVIGKARSVLGDRLVTDGRSEADIRRQVVDASMGQAARGWSDDQVASSFAVLTKDAQVEVEAGDGLARVLSSPARSVSDGRDVAYDEYNHNLSQAHLPESRRTKFVSGRPGVGYQ